MRGLVERGAALARVLFPNDITVILQVACALAAFLQLELFRVQFMSFISMNTSDHLAHSIGRNWLNFSNKNASKMALLACVFRT